MQKFDLIGIGAGPFNLSTAALAASISGFSSLFLDTKQAFSWHPGMMLPDTLLQTSFLKDLVTSADPTNPYSFLAYLVKHRRFYRFINADFAYINRCEFSDYLNWVAQSLPNVKFGTVVTDIDTSDSGFVVTTNQGILNAHNLVIATGNQPYIPEWAHAYLGTHCFHSSQYMLQSANFKDKDIVIVGGGQSGLEILLNIMKHVHDRPRSISLLSRRQTLLPLDESPFVNEFFTPDYVDAFYPISTSRKALTVESQKLASDGASASTLKSLIQALYACDFLGSDQIRPEILPNREVVSLTEKDNRYYLTATNRFSDTDENISADVLILSTGYQNYIPECLGSQRKRWAKNSHDFPTLNKDYSIEHPYAHGGKIYIQNIARFSHGIADPQLSLAAWRSAIILNAILAEDKFYVNDSDGALKWQSTKVQ